MSELAGICAHSFHGCVHSNAWYRHLRGRRALQRGATGLPTSALYGGIICGISNGQLRLRSVFQASRGIQHGPRGHVGAVGGAVGGQLVHVSQNRLRVNGTSGGGNGHMGHAEHPGYAGGALAGGGRAALAGHATGPAEAARPDMAYIPDSPGSTENEFSQLDSMFEQLRVAPAQPLAQPLAQPPGLGSRPGQHAAGLGFSPGLSNGSEGSSGSNTTHGSLQQPLQPLQVLQALQSTQHHGEPRIRASGPHAHNTNGSHAPTGSKMNNSDSGLSQGHVRQAGHPAIASPLFFESREDAERIDSAIHEQGGRVVDRGRVDRGTEWGAADGSPASPMSDGSEGYSQLDLLTVSVNLE